MRALFLTWDGPHQTYLESLFFPIFSGLAKRDVEVSVLQVTWAEEEALAPVRRAADLAGIAYASARIPRSLRKLALPVMITYGALQASAHLRRLGAQTLFPRSLIPMSMALLLKKATPGLDLVFDADGFMADERVDFGGWRATGLSYRSLRRVEARGVRDARAVLCRTQRAKQLLIERAALASPEKIIVAPNGKDCTLFSPGDERQRRETRARFGIAAEAPWLVYVGSLGPQYYPELMLEAFAQIHAATPAARFSCFTFQGAVMDKLLSKHRLPQGAVQVGMLPPSEVPSVLAACDLGFALRKTYPSQRGVSPIKVAEYLLCGAPVVATPVGDLEQQLSDSPAALIVDPEVGNAPQHIAQWFLRTLPNREARRAEARAIGSRWFALQDCTARYADALRFGTEHA